MGVRAPFCIVAEGLDGQGDVRNPQMLTKSDPKKTREARCRALAQFVEQFAIIEIDCPSSAQYARLSRGLVADNVGIDPISV